MISFIRRIVKSWVALILIGLLIISFAVWGMNDVFLGMGNSAVVKAGAHEVTPTDFRREFNQQKERAEEQTGEPIPVDMAVERGLDRQVLEGLANRAALAEMFHRMGVRVSDQQIAEQIKQIPAFFDRISGKFDEDLYASALAERQLTPESFERLMRDDMASQQVVTSMAAGVVAPRAYTALGAAYALERRDMRYFIVNPSMVDEPPRPTDEQLTAFMKENAAQLTRPEFRTLTLVRFSASSLAPQMKVDPKDVADRFEFRRDSLSTPELRTVVQIPAKTADDAAKVAQALSGGGDVAAAAKSIGAEPVVYASKPRTAIVDRRVAQAAFALPKGGVSGPIEGELGFAVVKVMDVTPGKTASLAEVRDEIEDELRADAAAEKVYEQSQVYEDAHTAGATLAEAAARAGVETLTIGPITEGGRAANGEETGVPEQVLSAAFALPQGGESDIEEAGRGEYFAVRVEKVTPAALPKLDEVRANLTQAWMLRKLVENMQTKADALAERVEKGEPLADVAASTGARVETAVNVSRARAQESSRLGRDVLIALFTGKADEVFTAQSPQFGIAVAKIEAIKPAPTDEVAGYVQPQRGQMSRELFEDLGSSAEAYARTKLKATTDIDLARQAIGIDPTLVPTGDAPPEETGQ